MHHTDWRAGQAETAVEVEGHDLSVAYHDTGEGPPVVLLHGIPTWSYLWWAISPALADDHRVVAPDLLGYGHSAMHEGFDRSIRAQEAMVSALMDALGIDSAAVVGHDIGGSVALRLAWHEPDRVDRLVLSNATCFDSWPVEFVNGLGVPGAVTEMGEEEFDATFTEVFAGGLYGDGPHEEFVDGMLAPWQSSIGRTSLERCAVATNTNHTTEIDYGSIDAETLLLWGAEDVLQPIDNARRLETALGGPTTLVGLEKAYHWVVEDRPEAYAREVDAFLA